MGRLNEAKVEIRQALELEPDSVQFNKNLADLLYNDHRVLALGQAQQLPAQALSWERITALSHMFREHENWASPFSRIYFSSSVGSLREKICFLRGGRKP